MTINIESRSDDTHCLLVDGGQAGLYTSDVRAKAAARRFIFSYQRLSWNRDKNGWSAQITNKKSKGTK